MKCIPFDKENLKKAIKILKDGGVIAHPADTCYGLAADPMNKIAVKNIQDTKGRDKDKPMSIMFPAFMKPELNQYVKMDSFSKEVCHKLFPGPITILLPRGERIPNHYFPDSPYIGIRIPYDMNTEDI